MPLRRSLLAFVLAAAASPALAHVPLLEPQVAEAKPWKALASADASWEAPFWLPAYPTGVEESMAVFAYLSPGDQDVFAFRVTRPMAVAASALPPACNQTKEHFPVTALVGPPGWRPTNPVDPATLPFPVPPGAGVALAGNPRPAGGAERAVFSDPTLGLAWFLPEGLTQDCLFGGGCDFRNTIAEFAYVPGVYYLVMWDPDGVPQDYTANIGFRESGFPADPAVVERVRDEGWLHGPCTPPYPAP